MLTKRGRNSNSYRSAVLNALDVPVAKRLQQYGLVFNCAFDDWFNLTEKGTEKAIQLLESADA